MHNQAWASIDTPVRSTAGGAIAGNGLELPPFTITTLYNAR